jgi:hypothetical protein
MRSFPTNVTEALTRHAGRCPTVVIILGIYGSPVRRRLFFVGEPLMTYVLLDMDEMREAAVEDMEWVNGVEEVVPDGGGG